MWDLNLTGCSMFYLLNLAALFFGALELGNHFFKYLRAQILFIGHVDQGKWVELWEFFICSSSSLLSEIQYYEIFDILFLVIAFLC